MLARRLRARTRQNSGIAVIDLHGDVDGSAHDAFRDAYARAKGWHVPAILLNFADVGYINSKGIALIVGLLSQASKASVRLLACGLSDHYVEIFEITRLSEYIDIHPDEATALLDARAPQAAVSAHGEDGSVAAR